MITTNQFGKSIAAVLGTGAAPALLLMGSGAAQAATTVGTTSDALGVTVNVQSAGSPRPCGVVGRVLGLRFFNYSTAVQLTVSPGTTDTLRYRLDLYGPGAGPRPDRG